MGRGKWAIPMIAALSMLVCSGAAGQERERAAKERVKVPVRLEYDRNEINRLISLRRYNEAIGLLKPLCDLHVDRHDLTELLTRCYLRAGRPAEAADLLEDRMSRAPGRMGFVRDLAMAYLDLGEKAKALAVWEGALGEGERSGEMFGSVARMQWDAGMHDLSLETLRRGAAFPGFFEVSYREIIRIERTLGRGRDAFLSAVELFAGTKEPMKKQPRILLETWKEAGQAPDLLARVDSLADPGSPNSRFFHLIGALLRAQAGDFNAALRLISGSDGREATAEEIYYFAAILLEMDGHRRSPGYQRLYDELLAVFSGRFARSSIVPQMLLSAARFNMENGDSAALYEGGRGGSEAIRYYEKALSLADSASRHPAARGFVDQAELIRARLLVERLYRPSEAMDTMAGRVWRRRNEAHEAAGLRLEGALATGRWEDTEIWLRSLEASADTVLNAFGVYGRGMLELYRGRYDEAAGTLSAMAKEYPGSRWANDALSWAIAAKKAATGEDGAMGIFIDALRMGASGDFDGAAAALGRMVADHSGSSLVPWGMWERARLLELSGRTDEAVETLSALTERYPEDVYAPRALEKTGDIMARTRAEAGSAAYGLLLRDYQGYPFISRVRTKYIDLQERSKTAGREGAGS